MDDDSQLLLDFVELEKQKQLCQYCYHLNENSELTFFLYQSLKMREIYDKYNDVILIDSTLKKNRFNMPVILIICIDNYGLSRIVAFGLLSYETKVSYNWFIENFKQITSSKDPLIVFTD